MQSLVLDPMGMRDSTFRPLVAFTHPVALGHDGKGVLRPLAEHAGNYPPGSLFTSAEDLGRFFAALTPQMLERLTAKRVLIPAQNRSYGYGLIADDRHGPSILLHPGGRSGYGSTFMFLPGQRVAIAVLANRTSATMSSAAFEAVEQFAKLEEVKTADPEVALKPGEIAALIGTYVNGKGLPSIELAQEREKLIARFAGKSLAVTYTGSDRFHVDGGAQLETFVIVRDKNGSPRYLCAETWAFRKRS
jgi:CubicO group peptidase (beta-lactamase class C family)